jgi:hypothetical protein
MVRLNFDGINGIYGMGKIGRGRESGASASFPRREERRWSMAASACAGERRLFKLSDLPLKNSSKIP